MSLVYLNSSRGFTLIELMVVITIIGLLASTVLASLQNSRAIARDSSRVSDAKQLQSAVELFRNRNGLYPCSKDNAVYSATVCAGAQATVFVNDGTITAATVPLYRRNNFRTDLLPFMPAITDAQISGTEAGTIWPDFGSVHYATVANRQSYTITVYSERTATPLCTLTQDKNDC